MNPKTVNNIKKGGAILLAILLAFSISACGKTIGTGGDKPAGGVIEVKEETSTDSASENKETSNNKEAKNETTSTSDSSAGQQANADDTGDWNEGDWDSDYNGGGTDSYDQPEQPTEPPAQTWTISVTIDGKEHGGIFGGGTYSFYYQPTAFDALTATGLPYEGSSDYISSINGLAHFDYGKGSGWLYAVNGVEPSVGCGNYYLNDGDSVYWHYTDDYTLE